VPPIARNSTTASHRPHCGASHFTRTHATGKRLLLSPPGSSTLTPPSAPHLRKDSNGHRIASEKGPPPLLAASGPHSTSSNTWAARPRTSLSQRENTSTPPWPHLQRYGSTSASSSQPHRFNKTRLIGCASLRLWKYWQNVPSGKTCPRVNSQIVLNLEVCKTYLHM
jgi:hypothetical protein